MIKKIFFLVLFIFLGINLACANSVDFYGEKNESWDILKQENVDKLKIELNKFYRESGLNTDLVILGKGDNCYLNNNFDSCIQKRENYASDLIIVLSMKSDVKDRGDIRSLIKDEFKESIAAYELINIQDSIISYFKVEDFTTGIINYLDELDFLIKSKCSEIGVGEKCNAVILAKQYHQYVLDKEVERKEAEIEAKYNSMMRIIYYIIFVVFIVLSYLGFRKIYIYFLNNLYKDIKYKQKSLGEFEIFEKDKNIIIDKLKIIEKEIKIKLGDLDKNAFSLRSFYKNKKDKFTEINKELSNMQKSFLERSDLKDKVEKMKKIDL